MDLLQNLIFQKDINPWLLGFDSKVMGSFQTWFNWLNWFILSINLLFPVIFYDIFPWTHVISIILKVNDMMWSLLIKDKFYKVIHEEIESHELWWNPYLMFEFKMWWMKIGFEPQECKEWDYVFSMIFMHLFWGWFHSKWWMLLLLLNCERKF